LDPSHEDRAFQTTSWTLIAALDGGDERERAQAKDLLCRRYWSPVYAYFRMLGANAEESLDLTQSFFADVVLGRDLIGRTDRKRGRLRVLIRTAAKRYAIDQHRRSAIRPDFISGIPADQISQEEQFITCDPAVSPEDAFERRWAMAVLEEAMARCAEYCARAGLERHWKAFEAYTIRPAVSGVQRPIMETIAAECGFTSAMHVASALKVVRKRLRLLLLDVVAETTMSREELKSEHARLVDLLGLPNGGG
jgi:hypothetical protein